MAIYEGGAAVTQARSLWRIELIRIKWHGALVGWEQPFRIRHITSGRYGFQVLREITLNQYLTLSSINSVIFHF